MKGYLIYRLGIFFALHAPLKIAYFVASLLADIHFFISKKDRTAVIENLKVALGETDGEVFHTARLTFRNFAKYLVDFFRFSKIDSGYIKKYMKIIGISRMDNILKRGRGCILVTAHLGNWELGGAVTGKLGYKINVIALDHKNPRVNNIFVSQRSRMGVNVIPIGMALKKCFSALKNNEVLGLLGDRDFSAHGIDTVFFGKHVLMPKGPAAFSIKTGAPIVPVFILRNRDETFTFIFENEIDYRPTGNFEADTKGLTDKILRILEGYIRKYPDQWYVFRKFWN